jgi:hypothetical protein
LLRSMLMNGTASSDMCDETLHHPNGAMSRTDRRYFLQQETARSDT